MSNPNPSAPVVLRGSNHDHIVSYRGRDGVVIASEPLYSKTVSSLLDVTGSISKIASSKNDPLWTNLSEELITFTHGFLDVQTPIRRFQLDLLIEAVLPYLQDIQARIHTDKLRFSQVNSLSLSL
jgi:hypothetical protein